jgi:hypothetical protein
LYQAKKPRTFVLSAQAEKKRLGMFAMRFAQYEAVVCGVMLVRQLLNS